jgi:hypothetical protein
MTEEQAKRRFLLLSLMRAIAMAMVLFGVAIIAGKTRAAPNVGYFVFVIGAINFFVIPRWLKKVWQAQSEEPDQ